MTIGLAELEKKIKSTEDRVNRRQAELSVLEDQTRQLIEEILEKTGCVSLEEAQQKIEAMESQLKRHQEEISQELIDIEVRLDSLDKDWKSA